MGAPSDGAPLQLVCDKPPAICQVQFRLLPGAGSRWTSCPWVSTLVRHNAPCLPVCLLSLEGLGLLCVLPLLWMQKGLLIFSICSVFCLLSVWTGDLPSSLNSNWKSTILIPLSMGISFLISTLRNKLLKERNLSVVSDTLQPHGL